MNKSIRIQPSVGDRIAARTDKTESCWLWRGAKAKNGYGYMSVKNRVQPVHRLAYEVSRGEIPEGHDVDHTCFVRHCVNPAHLRAVTRKQNMEHLSGANANSKTGVRGVHFNPLTGFFIGEVWHHKKRIRVGYFRNLDEADAAVRAKRLALYTHDDAAY